MFSRNEVNGSNFPPDIVRSVSLSACLHVLRVLGCTSAIGVRCALAQLQADWRTYNAETGTRVEYPATLFSEESGIGRFRTADGRAVLSIFAKSIESQLLWNHLGEQSTGSLLT